MAPILLLLTPLVTVTACKKGTSSGAPTTKPLAGPVTGTGAIPAGIPIDKLDETKRKVFDQIVNREPSACGKGHSLLDSVKNDSSCPTSFYAVRYVARLVEAGTGESEITQKLEQRFRSPRVPKIDVSLAPSKGATGGRVTIVEFADYECSHCKDAQALFPQLVAEFPKDLTVYFKHFPLGGHVGALNAALAAVAAQNQGKFWEFNEKVWEYSDRLSPAVLESIGKDIKGLDFKRWYSDVGTEDVRGRVSRERAEARSLEIQRTPGVFINGRRYTDALDLPSLKDWIEEELGSESTKR
jgi:protein-disulfide isomerase